jgi:glycosyltransferase involved in cell wall biosynthesis
MTNDSIDMDGISVVIPAYNEEGAISNTIREVRSVMDASKFN